ncbi:hypothetical protein ABTE87_19685, partial [Acinetobacter baumannii]
CIGHCHAASELPESSRIPYGHRDTQEPASVIEAHASHRTEQYSLPHGPIQFPVKIKSVANNTGAVWQ